MNDTLIEILILFMIMAFGYIYGKKGTLDAHTADKISILILNGTLPALIISSMDREFQWELFRNTMILLGFTAVFCGLIILCIELYERKNKGKNKAAAAIEFCIAFGNTSFMGMPVMQAMYGSEGVFYVAAMCIIFNFLMFSYGIYILSRQEKPDFKKIFLNPGLISTLIGFLLFVTPLSLPYIISRPLSWCGDMTIPMALLSAGSIISRNSLKSIVRPASVWVVSMARIVGFPLVMTPILLLLGVDMKLISILVIVFATPAPLTAGAFVGSYDGDVMYTNKVIVLSNLLSVITMTALAAVFTMI